MSTKPGATTRPVASMTSDASPSTDRPTAAITPSLIATSPTNVGRPVPSTMVPPVIFRSNTRGLYTKPRSRRPLMTLEGGLDRPQSHVRRGTLDGDAFTSAQLPAGDHDAHDA